MPSTQNIEEVDSSAAEFINTCVMVGAEQMTDSVEPPLVDCGVAGVKFTFLLHLNDLKYVGMYVYVRCNVITIYFCYYIYKAFQGVPVQLLFSLL